MTIGASIFLIAIGAILTFAVNVSSNAIDLDAIGAILMIAGLVGLLVSLFFWSTASSRRAAADGTGSARVEERHTTTREF